MGETPKVAQRNSAVTTEAISRECACDCRRAFVPRRAGRLQRFFSRDCRKALKREVHRRVAREMARTRQKTPKSNTLAQRLKWGIDAATGRRIYITPNGLTFSRAEALKDPWPEERRKAAA